MRIKVKARIEVSPNTASEVELQHVFTRLQPHQGLRESVAFSVNGSEL